MTAPLLPLALAFAVGVGLGLEVAPPGWLAIGGAGLAGLLLCAAARRTPIAAAGLLVLAALAGWARVALPDPFPPIQGLAPGAVLVEGLVAGTPEPEPPRTRFPLLLQRRGDDGAPARGLLSVWVYGAAPDIAAGSHVRIDGVLRAPVPFRNPGRDEGAPRTPRYFLTARGDGVAILPAAPLPWWLRVRLGVHATLAAHLPPVSAALLEGLLIGERRQLPPTLLADFRRAGVLHVLAISGFNVALVAGSAYLLLRLVRLPAALAALLALATLLAFAGVVGGQPSVLRATIMGGLFLAASLLGRESRSWNSLAAALLGLLALDPGSLAEPGLQLSFAATAGLLHLGPWIRGALPAWCPGPVASALSVSIGAQLGVTPVLLAHWGQLSPLGVLANLVVVPLAAVLTTGGLLALAMALLHEGLGALLFQSLWLVLVALRWVVRVFAALPGAALYLPASPVVARWAAGLALALAPCARGRTARLVVVALTLAAVGLTLAPLRPDGLLHVLVLDVGTGEATLIRAPGGQALLVDTGGGGPGRGDRGERVVVPVLRRLGVQRLTALALTSGVPDRAGGLAGVLEGLPVETVWVPAGSEGAGWQAPLADSGTRREALARGDRRWLGPVLVTVLHPPPPEPGGPGRAGPLVLRIDWGLFAAVLAGSADARVEAALVGAGAPLAATVLGVGTHGSARASTERFLDQVRPRIGLIAVGGRNPFGHPAPAALARLDAAGAMLYRTDLNGAIDVATDGTSIRVRTARRPDPDRELRLGGAP